MSSIQTELKKLPGVDKLLSLPEIKVLIERYSKDLVTFAIRSNIAENREKILQGETIPEESTILSNITKQIHAIGNRSLKPVVNATGIIVHTNLGRAPYGDDLIDKVIPIIRGYNNLEFDLSKGERGERNQHAAEILKYLTGAEDVVVVNNNAAAVMLILRAFARNKEVIVSRGELIEIGGSFRIPDIMATSDCKMVEVGTTNKTKASDYENAITDETAMLFKAHKSNYVIKGFTQEAELSELVEVGKKNNIPVVYDIGSGLIRKTSEKALKNEPDVKQALASGIDLICFSGDKLLGGPQAGVIAGKREFIKVLKKHPMLRAMRVCKTSLAFLEAACLFYLNDDDLFGKSLPFKFMKRQEDELLTSAEYLQKEFTKKNINSEVVKSKGQYGGGTLPDIEIKSYSVKLIREESNKKKSVFAEKLHQELLNIDTPILTVLKKGDIYFDMLTLTDENIKLILKVVPIVYQKINDELDPKKGKI